MHIPKIASTSVTAAFAVAGLAFLATGLTVGSHADQQTVFYVAPSGNNANAGTQAAPFQTVKKAVSLLPTGGTVMVASGEYTTIKSAKERPLGPITVKGYGPTRPVIKRTNLTTDKYALIVAGSANITYENFTFDGTVGVGDDMFHTVGSSNITVTNSEVIDSGGSFECGVSIRSMASNITISNNYIHQCFDGIAGAGNAKQSDHINILGNLINDMQGNGIDFGNWDDVTIDHNIINDIDDRRLTCAQVVSTCIHNDGIQFFGATKRAKITNNIVANSVHGQCMLIQPSVGPIEDVLVQNNLFFGAGGYCIQSNAKKLVFVNNTVWQSHYGGLLIREFNGMKYNQETPYYPSDGVIANNIFSGLSFINSKGTPNYAYRNYNYFYKPDLDSRGKPVVVKEPEPNGIYGTDPGFVGRPAPADYPTFVGASAYLLRSDASVKGKGVTPVSVNGMTYTSPVLDILSGQRPNPLSMGATDGNTPQPPVYTVRSPYGAPGPSAQAVPQYSSGQFTPGAVVSTPQPVTPVIPDLATQEPPQAEAPDPSSEFYSGKTEEQVDPTSELTTETPATPPPAAATVSPPKAPIVPQAPAGTNLSEPSNKASSSVTGLKRQPSKQKKQADETFSYSQVAYRGTMITGLLLLVAAVARIVFLPVRKTAMAQATVSNAAVPAELTGLVQKDAKNIAADTPGRIIVPNCGEKK